MPNIIFKLGSLDLSTYVKVNPDDNMDPAQGDHLEPAFSDSPFFEGQILTSLHAKNKEMKWPLFIHPTQAPYLQDALNQLVAGINQQLRSVTDLGMAPGGGQLYAQWQNAQASNPTFFTVQFGRFEPQFVFRQTEKGWLAGTLHLWVLPYGHTATERIVGTWSAPANQSGLQIPAASLLAGATKSLPAGGGSYAVMGDVSPQFDLRMTTGSYTGDDGQVGIVAALPVPSYTPIIPVGSFFGLSPSVVIYGASGAWASQFLALDSVGGSQGQAISGTYSSQSYFSFALSPASVYAGDNRVFGLVRSRNKPFGLRAFDSTGNPLGPTVIASAMDGWQLVDYGVLSMPPWVSTAPVNIQAYSGIDYNASGMFSSPRAAPPWTKEHGPVFILPNAYSLVDLDFNSPVLTMDGFDGASGAVVGQDQLGNTWIQGTTSLPLVYNGTSAAFTASLPANVSARWSVGTALNPFLSPWETEGVFTFLTASNIGYSIGMVASDITINPWIRGVVEGRPSGAFFTVVNGLGGVASVAVPSFLAGQYSLKLVSKGTTTTGYLWGPSGAYAGSASGAPLSLALSAGPIAGLNGASIVTRAGFTMYENSTGFATGIIESFRARTLASSGHQSLDTFHLHQPQQQNTRMLTASGPDVVDLQQRQRGPLGALSLPVPSLGAGIFAASFNWDQGPANDLLSVDLRMRERFTYAR